MSQHFEKKRESSFPSIQAVNSDSVLLIRLILAVVIFAVTLILDMSPALSLILRMLCAIIAGIDLAYKVAEAINARDYFSEYLIILFVAVFSFAIGYSWEGAAVVLVYQFGQIILDFVISRSKKSAAEQDAEQDENVVKKLESIIDEEENSRTELADSVNSSAGSVLLLAAAFAVIFAIFLPIFTNFDYKESIHRALIMLIVATPGSVVVALPIVGVYGIGYGARQGIIFKNARVLEKSAETATAVFDKSGIFTSDAPEIVSFRSDILSADNFMTFAAHAVYYSEQPIAAAVAKKFTGDYRLEFVSDFKELPGYGVELDISENHVIFAVGEYFDSIGMQIPKTDNKNGQAYYMTVGEHYAGEMVVFSGFNEKCSELSANIKEAGVEKTVLLTEDGKNESEETSAQLGFDAFYSNCNPAKKKEIVEDITNRSSGGVMYIYSTGIESHSGAAVDVRVSRKGKYADALILPEKVENVPMVVSISRRAKELAYEAVIFTFAVKALMIFLAINGWCAVWFALFMDFAATAASVLNASRISSESLRNRFQKQ